ncbi:MAG: hypothetical protein RR448_10895, partial [Niameybacter sp.]
ICYGEMKEEIKQHIQNGKKTYMTNQDIWFSIENIATYHITDGNLVVVEPCENCDTQLMKLFLMCSCMGFIMIQRN